MIQQIGQQHCPVAVSPEDDLPLPLGKILLRKFAKILPHRSKVRTAFQFFLGNAGQLGNFGMNDPDERSEQQTLKRLEDVSLFVHHDCSNLNNFKLECISACKLLLTCGTIVPLQIHNDHKSSPLAGMRLCGRTLR